ncbi:MAG: glycosyltransferase family 2 protein [Bacteroidota bacterium]
MVNNPLVSICCVTYNHSSYIKQALDGFLLQQTNFNFEIVIGDDFSTDKTQEILKQYNSKHPGKFKIIMQEKNIGMISNFISTLRHCKGNYIALCDGDDYWTDPLKLQKQVDFLEANPTYSICTTRFFVKRAEGEEAYEPEFVKKIFEDDKPLFEISIENMFSPYLLKTLTVVFRNMAFDKKILSQPYFKDTFLWAKILTKGPGVCLNFHGGVYNRHSGGVWSERSAIEKGISLYSTSLNMVKYFGTGYSNIFSYYLGSENVIANLLKDNPFKSFKEFRIYCRIKVNRHLRRVYPRMVL